MGQRYAMVDGKIGPLTYNAARYGLSSILLLLFRPVMLHYSLGTTMKEYEEKGEEKDALQTNRAGDEVENNTEDTKVESDTPTSIFANNMLMWVAIAALSNYGGSILQQISLQTVTASKAGFISGSYVVVIPFVEWLFPYFHHGKLSLKVWLGALFCFIGIFFISGCTGFDTCFSSSKSWGEIYLLISVLFWVISILSADMASKRVDCLVLTIGEFMCVTVLTAITAMVFEPASPAQVVHVLVTNAGPIVLVAFTEAIAYFISTLGQMYVHPSRAAILYSGGESLSTCFLSFVFLGEYLNRMEMVGSIFLLVSTLISSSASADAELEEEEENEEGEPTPLLRIGSFDSRPREGEAGGHEHPKSRTRGTDGSIDYTHIGSTRHHPNMLIAASSAADPNNIHHHHQNNNNNNNESTSQNTGSYKKTLEMKQYNPLLSQITVPTNAQGKSSSSYGSTDVI